MRRDKSFPFQKSRTPAHRGALDSAPNIKQPIPWGTAVAPVEERVLHLITRAGATNVRHRLGTRKKKARAQERGLDFTNDLLHKPVRDAARVGIGSGHTVAVVDAVHRCSIIRYRCDHGKKVSERVPAIAREARAFDDLARH
jgi:hypothetical protein